MKFALCVFAVLAADVMWAQSGVKMSGGVTDAVTGQPVEGAAVTLNAAHTSYTDAAGNYSLDDVTPGAGRIAIRSDGYVAFETSNTDSERNFKLTPAASISGRITTEDTGGITRSVVVKLHQEVFTDGVRRFATHGDRDRIGVAYVDADGAYRLTGLEPGRYLISAGPPSGGLSFVHSVEGYFPTYYPGTPDLGAAIPISLGAGESRTADFKVKKTPLFRVTGEVESRTTESRKGIVEISATREGLLQYSYGGNASIPGTFVVEGLPPGQYVATKVTIRGDEIPSANGGFSSFSLSLMDVNVPFAITDHDVEGLRLIPRPARSQLAVNGSFRMANDGGKLPADLAVQFSYPEPVGQSDTIPAAPNGTFWLTGAPGNYSVRPLVPSGYAVTEIRYGGGNYLNSLIPMRGDTLDSSLTIVLSDQPGSVFGSIVDGESKPLAARIVVGPDPLPAGFDFRTFRVGVTDSAGAFAIGGLAPGRYKAVALTGDDRKRDHDLAILQYRLSTADAFEVTAGQNVTIVLRP